MKRFNIIIILAMVISAVVFLPTPQSAEAQPDFTFSGVVENTDPTFETQYTYCVNPGAENYDSFTFTPSVTMKYFFYSPESIKYEFYENSFNDASPATNYIDTGFRFYDITLNAGTTYVIVVSEASCGPGSLPVAWNLYVYDSTAIQGNTYAGDIDGTEPTYETFQCVPLHHYDLYTFSPPVSGTYLLADLGTQIGFDLQVEIFDGAFNPTDPNATLITSMDLSQEVSLTRGVTYYLAASKECGGDLTGTYEFTIFNLNATATPIAIPNTGLLTINAGSNTPVYVEPGGEQVKISGADLILPQDFDGGGSDTYIITSTQSLEGDTWYQIHLGANNLVWVRASDIN